MTPERQKWWDSLPKEEKRVRYSIKWQQREIIAYNKAIMNVIICDSYYLKKQIREAKHAIKALRKQIAMRPVWEGDDEQDYIHCPTCGSVVACCDYSDYELPKHCEDCGQKLRWKKCVD